MLIAAGGCLVLTIGILLVGGTVAMGFFAHNNLGGGSGGTGTTTGTVSSTTWVMPNKVLEKIQDKKADYQSAAQKKDIPWQLLAGINYRECGLADCGPSGEIMGNVNPDSHKVECPVSAGYSACLELIAKKIKSLAKMAYEVEITSASSEGDLIKAMVAYNRGNMYVNGGCETDESPYAWNQFDELHKNMRWPVNNCEPPSTRGVVNIPAGAFTVYSYLVNNGI